MNDPHDYIQQRIAELREQMQQTAKTKHLNSPKWKSMNPLFFLCCLTFLLFLGLKLGEVGAVAAWSWWWVTAPIWGYFGFFLVIIVLVFLAAIIVSLAGGDIR